MPSLSVGATPAQAVPEPRGLARIRASEIAPPVRREIIVGLFLLLVYGFFQQDGGWNQNSRLDLIQALVEHRTTVIDAYQKNTGDKAYYDGHFYSDKAPGTAVVGVPVYVLLKVGAKVSGTGTVDPTDAVEALGFVEAGVATVLLVILLLRFLRPAVGEQWALVMSLGYGLGSLALPFATMFFGHALSTFCLFAAFYLVWRGRAEPRPWRMLLAGVMAGMAVLTELPVVIGLAVIAGYAVWVGRRQVGLFVLGGLPMLVVLMAYDWVSFGSPFSIGYQHATFFAGLNQQGIISVVWPTWARAETVLVGQRGLLSLAPWLAIAPLGILASRRPALRAEVVVCTALCLAFVTYNSGVLNPLGGWTPGPRYLLPALPFATILVALAPVLVRPLTAFLIAVSVVIFFVATVTIPAAPTAFESPLFDLWIPRLLAGDLTPTLAELHWGLDNVAALIILVVAAIVATAGLLATFRPGSGAGRLTGAVTVTLLVLIVLLALPLGT